MRFLIILLLYITITNCFNLNKLTINKDRKSNIINMKSDNILKKISLKDVELKHSRIAMLAVIGRLSAESIHPIMANKLYSDNLLVNNELVPSILNGGLNKINPIFYIYTFIYISIIELNNVILLSDLDSNNIINNNSSFDPLNIYNSQTELDKKFIKYDEITFGRIAMITSTWFTYYEYISQKNVITPELISLYPWIILGIIIGIYT